MISMVANSRNEGYPILLDSYGVSRGYGYMSLPACQCHGLPVGVMVAMSVG